MQMLLTAVATAVLAALPAIGTSDICLARACTIGTPFGAGPACSYQLWAPGRSPCGSSSAEINPREKELDDYLPNEFTLCGERITLVNRNTLSMNGQEYSSSGENNENRDCDYHGHDCLTNYFAESFFPAIPICDK